MPNESVTPPEPSVFAAPELLVEHARRFYTEGRTPAPPKTAATVLLLRPGTVGTGPDDDFEVYVIRRAASMTFGGVYAFPGGGVDPSDSAVRLGWSGPSPQEWGRRLNLPAAQAQAVICAAVREVFEEVGVLLAGPHPETVVGDVSDDSWEKARQDLVARRIGFADLLHERQLTVRSDLLLPWARWITPEFEPRRFDTFFFVALLPQGQRTRDVSSEADLTMWVRPADIAARAAAGELTMLPPTLVTLGDVAACGGLDRVIAAGATRDVNPVTPRLELDADGEARFLLH